MNLVEMQELLRQNAECADCGLNQLTAVDLYNGVFLCENCAVLHSELNFPIKNLNCIFTPDEITQLSVSGNSTVNNKLCNNSKPWFPNPHHYPYLAVRRYWIKAKYRLLTFAGIAERSDPRHSLDEFWFYLDEVSSEKTSLQGPMSRVELKETMRSGDRMRPESYVWHPVLGKKWVSMEKLHKKALTCESESERLEIYRHYEARSNLASQQAAIMRGLLDVQRGSKVVRRWIMLINTSVYVCVLSQTLTTEIVYSLPDLQFDLTERDGRLGIRTNTQSEDFTLWALTSDEILEWFASFRFSKHMLDTLGFDDFPYSDIEAAEQHICNVKSSPNYMGKKVKEGVMRKEGSNWKTVKTRWFVLRTQALYYYKNAEDKVYRGTLQLKGARISSFEQYRYPHHVAVVQGQKVLHLWMEDGFEKDRWVAAMQSVIDLLSDDLTVAGIG